MFRELSPRVPENAILCADSGSPTNWYACDLKMRRGMQASPSSKLASMGSGVPYAIAAKMAYLERPVLAIVGGPRDADERQLRFIWLAMLIALTLLDILTHTQMPAPW